MAWELMSESEWRRAFYMALDGVRGEQFSFVTGAGRLRLMGNAIVPQVAACFMRALREAHEEANG